MKCPICHGKGRIQDHKYNEEHDIEYLVYCEKKCEYCNGTGKVNEPLQTNEEWRKTCSTEEFAEFLSDVVFNAIVDYQIDKDNCEKEDGNYWLKWLKQPHREE